VLTPQVLVLSKKKDACVARVAAYNFQGHKSRSVRGESSKR